VRITPQEKYGGSADKLESTLGSYPYGRSVSGYPGQSTGVRCSHISRYPIWSCSRGFTLSLLLSVVRPLLHHFTFIKARKWYVFRCTVRRFKLPGRYLMPCHPESGLSSMPIAYTATAKSDSNSSPITGVQNIKVGSLEQRHGESGIQTFLYRAMGSAGKFGHG